MKPSIPSLPIDSVLPKLKETLLSHPAVVLHAPPGAGKTTRVPLALLDAFPPDNGRIVMLEPRRIAAASAARWMAKTLGEEVGGTVGYTIRFDRKVSHGTRIEVVTEGVLTRRIQSDPGLEGTALVIFDEFHERSVHADLALALCIDVRKGLRPDLKLLVMSATIDTGPVAALLGSAPVLSSGGKAYPVEERYIEDRQARLPARVASAVRTALREANGDILLFLPGAGEIRSCSQELRETVDLAGQRLSLHPLFGDLPFEDQERAILPAKDHRKIVLATNIAETSLTIEGVHVVIDSGLSRTLRYDPATGMNRLVTLPVSRASAEQRKGRAGRLGPGVCYRLYGKQEFRSLVPFNSPEIVQTDLSQLALELAVWGVRRQDQLSWLDPPPAAAWDAAVRLLREIGALDREYSATAAGREMAKLPLHPRLSRLLLRSRELDCPRLGAELAALLTDRDIFRKNAGEGASPDPDISTRVDALRRWLNTKEPGGLADPAALRSVERSAVQLMRLMPVPADRTTGERTDSDTISRLLLAAFPDRVCKRRESGGQGYVHMQGRGVRISRDSHLLNSPYLLAAHADAGEKAEGFIHLAAPLSEEIIRNELGGRIETVRNVEWNTNEKRVAAAAEERLGALVLSSRRLSPSDDEALPVLCEALRASPDLLKFGKEARQLQARVGLLQKAFPGEQWPDLSAGHMTARPEDWLLPWLSGMRSAAELGKLDHVAALKAKLTRELQRLLEERTPLAITVPSGSRIRIDYTSGDVPVLAVKLQELFGLADTPAIACGRVKLLLHLLSPAGRPVQVTQDLRNFWNSVYPEVKKDLKGRYPRHPWPDDPWNAMPTKRAKPRK